MADDRPAWARRMYNERQARGWSQADVIRAMRAHYTSTPRQGAARHFQPAAAVQALGSRRGRAGPRASRAVLQADHRGDVRHGHARDVPGRPEARCGL